MRVQYIIYSSITFNFNMCVIINKVVPNGAYALAIKRKGKKKSYKNSISAIFFSFPYQSTLIHLINDRQKDRL